MERNRTGVYEIARWIFQPESPILCYLYDEYLKKLLL